MRRAVTAAIAVAVVFSFPAPRWIAPAPETTAAASGRFIQRSGAQLTLDGEPFTFRGLNVYNANSHGWCWYALNTGPGLDDALTAIGARKNVIRSWFFQPLAQPTPDTPTQVRTWDAFDHTLAVADAHGMKVIATLTDQWTECGNGLPDVYKGQDWYETGYQQVQPGNLVSYRDYVQEVVTRYKDDPRIAFWQLINEAETAPVVGGVRQPCPAGDGPANVLKAWAADMAALVKSIDQNHLVSLGTIGGGQCGARGSQYQFVHDVADIDLCEYHDYLPTQPMPDEQENDLQVRLDQCAALDKPLFVGEMGIRPNEVGGSNADRAAAFLAKIEAQSPAGVQGILAWAWNNSPIGDPDSLDIGPSDPMLDVLMVNRPPVAADDVTEGVYADAATPMYPLNGDLDVDLDPLVIRSVTQPANGVVDNCTSYCYYTPNAGYVGPDAFTYVIADGKGGTDQGVVSFEVLPDPPAGITITIPADGAVYGRGEAVIPQFTCGDPNDPDLECSGPQSESEFLSTWTVGTHAFTITAVAGNGQITELTHQYEVRPGPPRLTGQRLVGADVFDFEHGQITVQAICNPNGTSVVTYSASGPASGPLPGTYTESGTLTLGPQTIEPGQGIALGPVETFSAEFTIQSPDGNVTGTRSQSPPGYRGGTCVTPDAGSPFSGATLFLPAASYEADITTASGTSHDSGAGTVGIGQGCAARCANSFESRFASAFNPSPPPPDPDVDGDGVDDSIGTGSGAFDDGSGTVGAIVDAASHEVFVAPDPAGVRISVAGSGSTKAVFEVCGFTIRLAPGSEVVVSCGSITLGVISGAAELLLDGGRGAIVIPEGVTALVDQDPDGSYSVVHLAGSDPIEITIDGVTSSLAPGASLDLDAWAIEVWRGAANDIRAIVEAEPGPSADKLDDALAKLETALAELAKTPPDEVAALGNVEGAVGELEAAVKDGLLDIAAGAGLMDRLTGAALTLANEAIAEAEARGAAPRQIAQAKRERDRGDAARLAGRYKDAVARYKDALSKAEGA